MYEHTARWEEAQEREVDYWTKDYFRDSEFKELITKYSMVFPEIEKKYAFTDSTKILDLGCGATCPSLLFSKGERYGVDPLVDIFLDKDKKKLQGAITLKKGTGEAIPFEDNFFDVVLCRNALDHMDNIDCVMKEIQRVCRKGGIVILCIYTYSPFISFLKKSGEYISFLRNIEHPFTFTPPAFKQFCRRSFEVLEEKVIFEGTSSIDYGKEDVELTEPFMYKCFAWINRYIFQSNWFLREYLLISRGHYE